MIAFLTHHEIDKNKWDSCIKAANNSFIYGYSWYLDEIAPNWNALVLNDYEAVMPVPTVKKIFTIAYQPFFAQQLGIFSNHLSEFNTADFINKIPGNYKYINICINENNDSGSGEFKAIERNNYILYLHQSYDEIYKNFTDHCRRNIKRAEKEKLTLREYDPDEVVDFYITHKGPNTEGVKEKDYMVLKRTLHAAKKNKMLKAYKVVDGSDNVVAAAVFYIQPSRVIYQLGTASEKGREARAMYFLFSSIIKEHCSSQVILDFEGSEIPSIARFFNGFGSLCMPYYRIVINKLPWPFNWFKK
ncbi:MAG: hypothetical protein V4658_10845 [Bacteroidota bacterium]